jgi:TolB-like protein/DNA-binding SARP family transcriptional activator
MGDSASATGVYYAPSERLRVQLFGRFTASYGNQSIILNGRKAQALLAFIALADVETTPRERLVGLLWSESDDQRARGSLRFTLHETQAALRGLGFPGLLADKLSVGIDRRRIEVDVWEVVAAAEAGIVHPLLLARARITENMLVDLNGVDPSLNDWLRDTREAISIRLIAALERALAFQCATKSDAEIEAIARAILLLDPTREGAARTIMELRAAAGDVGTALGIYAKLWEHLDKDFDIEPSKETTDLLARLRLEQPEAEIRNVDLTDLAPAPTPVRGGYEARPSIAVLPFRMLGPPGDEYFGEGFVDNIIQALAGLRELFVISRASTANFRGADVDVKNVGTTLGVRYVLQGTVQRMSEQLRIHTVLVDAETGEVLRPSKYDGKLSDLFDLQDQIAIETVKLIAPHVRERELKRALKKHPSSMTAYDLVLQALGPLHDLEYSTFSRARGLLQNAIELDPTYAPAYSYAAYWHCYRIGQEWSTDPTVDTEEAEKLATAAINFDNNDATALAIHAHIQCFMKRDYKTAIAEFERALALSPNSAFVWTFSAITLSCAGEDLRAVSHAKYGVELSPAESMTYFAYAILAQAYFSGGHLEDAITYGRLANERNNRLTSNLRILGACLVEVGQLDEAAAIVGQHLKVAPHFRLQPWLKRTPLSHALREKVAANLRKVGMPD